VEYSEHITCIWPFTVYILHWSSFTGRWIHWTVDGFGS